MEPGAPELRVGCRLPVRVEQIVNVDTLVVTLSCGERSFTGILLDCTKKSGLFGLPLSFPKRDAPLSDSCSRWDPCEEKGDVQAPETVPLPPPPQGKPPVAVVDGLDPAPPLVPPLPAGSAPPFPPYFEGAPFPHPLWLRQTYNQWVPQPPPRTIKRTKRRLSRNRDPGRLIMSTIRLRPRQVLCEKCKNTLNPEEGSASQPSTKPRRRLSVPDKEPKKSEELDYEVPRNKREKSAAGELVPRSPVIKISYSTPQGKGEVVKIPSRVHGSLKPFCPQQALQNGGQDPEVQDAGSGDRAASGGPPASIPKLKLTRPVPSGEAPPPKIRLKPHRLPRGGSSSGGGQSVSIYKAELIGELSESNSSSAFYSDESSRRRRRLATLSSGSSGEEDDFTRFPQGKDPHDNLAFLMNYKRKADSSSLSVCSNDSLDESSSDAASPDGCDFLPGDDASVSSSSREERKTVPPLTVRLHTQSVPECVTEDGRTVAVGDVVWGKIPGCPWWPARVLDLSLSHKEAGEPPWREARVAWFGSPTTSSLAVSKLSPFSEFFKLRFNRKKKGVYRKAITEAAKAAEHLSPDIRELLSQYET
ncbi:PWWP domain-containing protein 2B [Dromiciops gliroides]|uniref:PWWP domain-containing protein 2B n=1 Tax=Dromiciops gliroides TaxID=33562 RepID=UPI001CC74144|nr:PWWP domain-containing protein 2B [Dromiciops gliroides]XP_043844217.1 PWWP domain-containing protein 2B [Dromiciops gliroides]XP_043844218.1 PWWP domain-containing protein 2B [Dromiciops gliroides]XP_043844219.1 PWWP domain-containing protein 2B [Dromiciops gliroides]XP_043844221.1 PWWP domain-containing protein 2B [Dromiciops gliroides]